MKNFRLLTTVLLLVMATLVMAANKKSKTFSGRFKNETVKEILKQMKKECGTSVSFQPNSISRKRKVTVHFSNRAPEEVLQELFDCEYVIAPGKRKNSFVISLVDQTPSSQVLETYVMDTTLHSTRIIRQEEVDSLHATIVTRQHLSLITLKDTILTTCNRVEHRTESGEVLKRVAVPYRHSLQAYLGGAYTSLGYAAEQGKNMGGIGGEVSLRYAVFFTPEWGLALGVDYDTYQSYARLNGLYRWNGQVDSEGESYNHLGLTHDWTEQQRIHEVSVPVMLEYQHRFNDRYGIFCGLGAYVGMPLLSGWSLRSGSLEHQGEYPQWGLTLDQITGHDFYTETVGTDFAKDNHGLELQMITVGAKADLGALIALTEQLDLFAGVYAKVDAMDIAGDHQAELGWKQDNATPDYRRHDFMTDYAGLLNTNQTAAVRPWEVGVKVGIHFRPKPKDKKKVEDMTICEVVVDSTYSSALRYDSLYTESQDTIASLRRMLQKSVIWFGVNDYQHPRLEPADILEQVAEILIANPSQRIAINGHASAEGNARANQTLSDRRAATVTKMLIELGVPAEQIVTKGYSSSVNYVREENEENPATQGRSAAELNRRVEIIPLND